MRLLLKTISKETLINIFAFMMKVLALKLLKILKLNPDFQLLYKIMNLKFGINRNLI